MGSPASGFLQVVHARASAAVFAESAISLYFFLLVQVFDSCEMTRKDLLSAATAFAVWVSTDAIVVKSVTVWTCSKLT